ncbi:MAG TPA: DNA repair protein RecN [Acidimicrobiales bacterium]
MLLELSVRDLGVIAEARLVFGPGLTAVTGETGAGKTLLVDAIGLVVGGRADAALVRTNAAEASVEGRFVTGDDEVVLSRVVPTDGRSRAYVNGRLATAGELSELGRSLIDLHGQHAHQSLLAGATQRAALDRFGAVDLEPLRHARDRIRGLDDALAGLGGDARARARELDLLRYQVDELMRADLTDPGEDDRLGAEEDLLAGAQAHREAGLGAVELLGEDGARDALAAAAGLLAGRTPFDATHDRLVSLSAELDDTLAELRRQVEVLDEDPQRLEEVGARLHLLHELRRKYGATLTDVLAYRDDVVARLAEVESHDERVAELEAEMATARQAELTAAEAVGRARRAAAPELARAVQGHLTELAMPNATVEVGISDDPEGREVTFRLAANPGDPPQPMARVASGGELARAMLALRLVLTEAPDTLLFDEVDAGVGGEAALAVGGALGRLGQRHQVLVVTHLAQVAAFADHQIAVDKVEEGGRALARARPVDGEDRVIELARMLSGLSESGSARRHALELLGGARAPERTRGTVRS